MTTPSDWEFPTLRPTPAKSAAQRNFEAHYGEERPGVETLEEQRDREARELWEQTGLEV